jgi:hypothetical protein
MACDLMPRMLAGFMLATITTLAPSIFSCRCEWLKVYKKGAGTPAFMTMQCNQASYIPPSQDFAFMRLVNPTSGTNFTRPDTTWRGSCSPMSTSSTYRLHHSSACLVSIQALRSRSCPCSLHVLTAMHHLSAAGCRHTFAIWPTRRSSRAMSTGASGAGPALLPPPFFLASLAALPSCRQTGTSLDIG